VIEFKEVSKQFGSKVVLDCVNFRVSEGQILFVIGRSGMGKSVLLKHIVGLLQPNAGEVWVDGKEVSQLPERDYFDVRKTCGMVFQHPALLDSMSVYENVAFGIRAHRFCESEEEIEARVVEKLKLVNLKRDLFARFPSELSFGIQKRVSIARTIAIEPKYLLFDEPTTGQDPIATTAINQLILRLAQTLKVTCLVVSHDMHCALDIADRIILLDQGRIVDEGTPDEMIGSSQPVTVEFMREAKERRSGRADSK